MSNAIQQEEALIRAAEAKRFRDDPQFRQAVANAEADIYWRWRTSDPTDVAGREALFAEQLALTRIQKQLTRPETEATFAREAQKQNNFRANLG